jgi:hypothetical protein
MIASQSGPNWKRTYRFKRYFFFVNILQAAAAVLLGAGLLWAESITKPPLPGNIGDGIAGIVLFIVAAYLIEEALHSAVTLEGDTVSVRHLLATRSLATSEILGVKTIWRRGIVYTVLLPKRSTYKGLKIERSAYAFDEEWVGWISSLPDLDKERILEVN